MDPFFPVRIIQEVDGIIQNFSGFRLSRALYIEGIIPYLRQTFSLIIKGLSSLYNIYFLKLASLLFPPQSAGSLKRNDVIFSN